MSKLSWIIISFLISSCDFFNDNNDSADEPSLTAGQHFNTIEEIPPPEGYKRIEAGTASFAGWLRNIHLKADNRVYLYNGKLKRRQSAQFAVMDISVGDKDLQQCADAVMRLRAEYLFAIGKYDEIVFKDNDGKSYKWSGENDKTAFRKYLENVFTWCGSASLEKQLNAVGNIHEMKPGDVFIKGGFPGHAMIVVDMAERRDGKKVYMLAQSYMPAQDIHIVKNPLNGEVSPWYELDDTEDIITPEWDFKKEQLRSW